jgi:hypothetical protein
MKVTFDIDCTPEEARAFLGLPNIAPMQERLMKEMEDKLHENLNTLDPEALMKTWLPMSFQGWNDMQKNFWDQMMKTGAMATPSTPSAKTDKPAK